MRLADEHRAGIEQALRSDGRSLGHVLGVDPGAVGRPDAGRVEEILNRERSPG
jgi:hypothetical protein